jgi:DNA-directed RNA polymerase subunit RPC12/RpoP
MSVPARRYPSGTCAECGDKFPKRVASKRFCCALCRYRAFMRKLRADAAKGRAAK